MSVQTHHGTSGLTPLAWAREGSREDLRVPGLLLFLLSAQFMTVIMLGASIAPGYHYNEAAISDLGVIGETALLFNASLIVVGVLNLAGGYLFYRWHAKAWLLALFGLAGIGAAGAGAVSLNTSDLHSIFALVAFVFFNLEAIGCAAVLPGPMKVISALAGSIGVVFVVLMVIGDGGNTDAFGVIGHGGTERMIVYPVMLWMMALGGYLMASPRDESSRYSAR
jgi:hypothetical membrane protein